MKITIGPYSDYFSTHQIAEVIMFWKDSDDDQVQAFGEWLAYGNKKRKKSIFDKEKRKPTLLLKFIQKLNKFKKERTVNIHIDKYDTWNMDHTLGLIILPMLKQLKETKHGAPHVSFDDVPDHLTPTDDELSSLKNGNVDQYHFDRWDYIIDSMIFSFSAIVDDDWERQFHSGNSDFYSEEVIKNGNTMFELKRGANDTHQFDSVGYNAYSEKIDFGLLMFGKYMRGLWD